MIMKLNTKSVTQAAAMLTLTSGMALAAADESSVCEGYSMTDVNNDGYISAIEANAYAKRQASDMDSDADGRVSREEYINCSKRNYTDKETGRTNAVADVDMIDSDKDGMISGPEYANYAIGAVARALQGDENAMKEAENLVYRMPDESKLTFDTVPLEELVSRSKAAFMMLDADASGDLSEEELNTPVFKPIDINDVLDREFDQADADKSGDLTQTELIAANEKRAEEAMKKAEEQTGEKLDPEVGAPVVYYTYPDTM